MEGLKVKVQPGTQDQRSNKRRISQGWQNEIGNKREEEPRMTGPGIGNEAISDKDARARYAREFVAAATVKELQQAMASGRLTSRDIVQAYIERMVFTTNEARLNAVLETSEALFIAEALDVERAHKGREVLCVIPVLVKDNVDTADMMHTSAGSLALANSYARKDAFIARRLREAGAIILGKANMTEWANMMTDNMPPGYSSRGGQVRNPYGPGVYHPGGSSSGSAAVAWVVPVSVGTETSGSILSRRSTGGRHKASWFVEPFGVSIPHTRHSGPFGTTVEDAAIL